MGAGRFSWIKILGTEILFSGYPFKRRISTPSHMMLSLRLVCQSLQTLFAETTSLKSNKAQIAHQTSVGSFTMVEGSQICGIPSQLLLVDCAGQFKCSQSGIVENVTCDSEMASFCPSVTLRIYGSLFRRTALTF